MATPAVREGVGQGAAETGAAVREAAEGVTDTTQEAAEGLTDVTVDTNVQAPVFGSIKEEDSGNSDTTQQQERPDEEDQQREAP